ncbi:MAG: CBS domain-containing protein [Megasphaera sp.]|jgi:CBS domain-containing protein|uniref:CBS domain-containing protein n=1 Tax=Megasphaera sp. TaxID=2023260 RepID=UPI0025C28F25|nr:CBS domain-containing protein [Megasphaera sp.]MCF0151798.1 CBS domain-containing protein [Megasphaera sp.]MCF0153941.1 CBS domain-containing protein [Megasphaera sp.]MCI7601333.1 CBS domain-containing protein [Megasphaera sp.]
MSKTAADIMEKNVITAQKDTSIFDLVDMFVENNITAIPIVKDDKEIIGIVTDADLLYKEVKPCVPQYVNLLGANIYYGNLKEYAQGFKKLFACTAEQLMTKKVVMASPDATMEDLASVMVAEHLKAIPIVKDKKLLGLVERKNILKQLYNEYGENTK